MTYLWYTELAPNPFLQASISNFMVASCSALSSSFHTGWRSFLSTFSSFSWLFLISHSQRSLSRPSSPKAYVPKILLTPAGQVPEVFRTSFQVPDLRARRESSYIALMSNQYRSKSLVRLVLSRAMPNSVRIGQDGVALLHGITRRKHSIWTASNLSACLEFGDQTEQPYSSMGLITAV